MMETKKRSTAIILALLMFCTSVGFSMDIHLCQGEFKSIAFFTEAEACHEKMVACPMHGKMKVNLNNDDNDCCSNQTFELDELESDYSLSSPAHLTDLQQFFTTAFIKSFVCNEKEFKVKKNRIDQNPVPYISRDIYALNQAFLL